MAIFNTDLEAFLFIIIITISLYILNIVISLILDRIKRISVKQKNKLTYTLRVISIGAVVYLLIEGFPSFTEIDPEYTAIITGATSTALAFATSEVFANFMAGVLLLVVDPFDVGDVVKIKGEKGMIKSIKLTKIVIQTFDFILVEISNKEVMSSLILNYTINLGKIKRYRQFKKRVLAPQDIGGARLDLDLKDNTIVEKDKEIRDLYASVSQSEVQKIHSFTFKMKYPYERFRIKVDKTEKLCAQYKEVFGFKPRFHIMDLGFEIIVKFRIITFKAMILLNNQPLLAQDIYEIIKE
ncbi:MAG: mechanosensitive ion channel [Candidatus Lokiarchaeota archaeon]|nr:mechanosensitive ion channel [Candidatus Lokiarchaeota archaeon]MBD3343393.1 mechanosensitive ion channel [Candidatus Lokiarchaeota archaeon]